MSGDTDDYVQSHPRVVFISRKLTEHVALMYCVGMNQLQS